MVLHRRKWLVVCTSLVERGVRQAGFVESVSRSRQSASHRIRCCKIRTTCAGCFVLEPGGMGAGRDAGSGRSLLAGGGPWPLTRSLGISYKHKPTKGRCDSVCAATLGRLTARMKLNHDALCSSYLIQSCLQLLLHHIDVPCGHRHLLTVNSRTVPGPFTLITRSTTYQTQPTA